MATFTKFQPFIEDLFEGVHNFGTNQLVAFMTASGTPPTNTMRLLSEVTQISYTNYSSRNITTNSSSQSGGSYKLIVTDLVLTLSGGAGAAFQYYGVYNDTPTSPADPVVGFFNHGSTITPGNGETVTFDFDGTNGLLSGS